ncbi:hypothetical protein [Arundinibacter roseus]|uniref:Uncharacterized protein n=1 Tax=Arundinibacter roseus TaxID=2070510 RepID=A0A4R4KR03_9BACT|nr:hypothetical protein [Arundinibacter roseus]TDB69079.1 hypothetical protein EZE20_01725 [Arundinibacter roseus]
MTDKNLPIHSRLDEGFENRRWTALPLLPHIEYLCVICESGSEPQRIYPKIFKDTPFKSVHGEEIWDRLKSLETLNLLVIERGPSNEVLGFHVHPKLPPLFREQFPSFFTNSHKPQPKGIHKIRIKGPMQDLEDGGSFRLEEPIYLAANTSYHFKITPRIDGSRIISIALISQNLSEE